MEVGSIIETTEAKKIRYEAKYLGPWVGCGGVVDVPCGVKFRVVEVDGDECRCLCLAESIVEKAKRLEIVGLFCCWLLRLRVPFVWRWP